MKRISPGSHWIAIFLLTVSLPACNPQIPTAAPVPTEDVQVYEGYYYGANSQQGNVSSFVPCDANEKPGEGKGYWLVTNTGFDEMYRAEAERFMQAAVGTLGPGMDGGIYIQFKGIAAPPVDPASGNGYGYQNRYRGQITVTEAIRMKYFILPFDEDLCQAK